MRGKVLGVVLTASLASAAFGQARDEAAIQAVIADQFADFRSGDLNHAFGHASPMIQGLFQTPENFAQMVQRGYPAIWQGAGVEFLGLRSEGGALIERLRVRNPQGGSELFDYRMINLEGLWRIDGVWPVEEPGIGV